MNKKILATLLIASMAITGLFAGKSAILNANKADTDYTFIIQYDGSGSGDEAEVNNLILDATERTTPSAFSIETGFKGNVKNTLTITTTVSTSEFTGVSDTATPTTISFPFIVFNAVDDTPELSGLETYEYTPTALEGAKYAASSKGTYVRTFRPGTHFAGTVIAQFKLSFQGNDDIIAGDYSSTTTVEIATA